MDEVRAPTQAGIRIRGRTYLIHLIHIHPQSQSQCLWQDSQRPQWESLHFRTERRVQDWPRGILLVIFPCFLRFWLRFWIGRGRQKLPFLFPFGWKAGYSVFIIKVVYLLYHSLTKSTARAKSVLKEQAGKAISSSTDFARRSGK